MTTTMKSEVMLRATATCPSHSRTDLSIRDLEFSIDEPLARGGTNAGPTPTDTALSALIGCTNVIGHKCAADLGIDIGHLTIAAACVFDRRGVTLQEEVAVPFREIDLTVTYDGTATEPEIIRLADAVRKFCPLSKLFREAGTEIREVWRRP